MRNIIVTGGSRGLGLGIAKTLAGAGYRVIAIARKESEPLTAAMREAETADGVAGGGAIAFRPFDLGRTDAMPALVRGLRKDFGAIYGLVNNAGLGSSGVLATMRDRDIQQLVHLNTVAPMTLTKYVARAMMTEAGVTEAGGQIVGGRIVNMSSIIATTGYSGLSVYAATKASLVGFTRSLARELGPLGITVNAIAPGFVDTEMTESLASDGRERVKRRSALRRLAEVDDVANTVAFLMSEGARNITGTVLTVDAGNTA